MSVAAPSTGAGMAATAVPVARSGETCPLCSAPLHPEQEWCLRCGAAARTRLAASPNWKGPIIALAIVIVLSLGVLAAALVELAGGSSPAPTTTTATVAGAHAAATPTSPTTTAGGLPLGTSAPTRTTPTSPALTHPSRVPRLALPSTPKSKLRKGSISSQIDERLRRLGLIGGARVK